MTKTADTLNVFFTKATTTLTLLDEAFIDPLKLRNKQKPNTCYYSDHTLH